MKKGMYFNFIGYAGWDVLLGLLPKSWQTRKVARAWLRMLTPIHGEPPDLRNTPLILRMPWGSFRIVDYIGNVERCETEHFEGL